MEKCQKRSTIRVGVLGMAWFPRFWGVSPFVVVVSIFCIFFVSAMVIVRVRGKYFV